MRKPAQNSDSTIVQGPFAGNAKKRSTSNQYTAQPKDTTNSPLEMFMQRHKISYSGLNELCGRTGSSRTTLHRLVHNTLAPEYRRKLNKVLAGALPPLLNEKGLSPAEIDEELLQLFDEGEYQPMINQRIELRSDEIKFFGLTADPFTRPPQSRDEVFISPAFQEVIDRVIDAVHYQGFISVTGPIGSGKSTLRALVEDHVAQNSNLRIVWPEFFDMRNVTPMQIAEAILTEFDIPKAPRSSVKRGNMVKELLAGLYRDGKRVAIGFDEIHRANDAVLSSLKNFLEMSSGGFQRYLGVIMFGQPVFEARLRDPHFQEIVERVVPLKMPEFSSSAEGYLKHRLRLVGGDINKLFDADALTLICSQAKTPLQLGNIANEAFRISKDAFKNNTVIGSAIKTKMFFEAQRDQQGWKARRSA